MRPRGLWLSVIPVSVLHLGLCAWSIASPDRAILGDRAAGRLVRARALVESDDRIDFVLQAGWPGDYGLHSLLLAVAGLPGLLLVQWALFVATLVMLHAVARRLGAPDRPAAAAVVVYGLLASNLHQPHTVVTEALFNPCVAAVVFGIEATLRERRLTWPRALAMGSAGAIAIALRAVFLPVLPVLAVHLLASRAARAGRLAALVAIAMLPLVAWAGFQAAHGQEITLGGEGFSLGHNLHGRMSRMAALGGAPVPDGAGEQAGVVPYLRYAARNPLPFVRATATDALMFVVNPGVNHVYGVFFGLFEKAEGSSYWVPLIDREGISAAVAELARRDGARVLANALGLLGWLGVLSLAGWGWGVTWRGSRHDFAGSMALLSFALVAGTFASHAVRWSQRSPLEFVLAIFFAVGLSSATPWLGRGLGAGRSAEAPGARPAPSG